MSLIVRTCLTSLIADSDVRATVSARSVLVAMRRVGRVREVVACGSHHGLLGEVDALSECDGDAMLPGKLDAPLG
jgi:hypothetical protein